MILPVALLLMSFPHKSVEEKIYAHPPADFKFSCTMDACPRDMGTSWVTIDEYNGKFMECHQVSGVMHDSSNCYDIPHQHIPAGCKPRRGYTWYQYCVALKRGNK